MGTELIAFLRARLDEDAAAARAAVPGVWIRHPHVYGVHADDSAPEKPHGTAVADCRRLGSLSLELKQGTADHIARHDPARVLREVEAKRLLLTEHAPGTPKGRPNMERHCLTCSTAQAWDEAANEANCLTLRWLALPYSDHPDYREEWSP